MEKHGVDPAEAEHIVNNPGRGYPRKAGDKKLTVTGRGQGDRMIQVVYVTDEDGTIFIIHAMPLTTRRKRGSR